MHYTLNKLKTVEALTYGPNLHKNLKNAIKYISPDDKCNFDDWGIEDGYEIDHESYDYEGCCCGHTIQYEYRIQHHVSGDSMEIGSACIEFFNHEARSKRNNIINRRKNPSSKFCIKCSRRLPQKLVDEFPEVENLYHKKCWKTHKLEKEKKLELIRLQEANRKLELFQNEATTCTWCDETPKRKDVDSHA